MKSIVGKIIFEDVMTTIMIITVVLPFFHSFPVSKFLMCSTVMTKKTIKLTKTQVETKLYALLLSCLLFLLFFHSLVVVYHSFLFCSLLFLSSCLSPTFLLREFHCFSVVGRDCERIGESKNWRCSSGAARLLLCCMSTSYQPAYVVVSGVETRSDKTST